MVGHQASRSENGGPIDKAAGSPTFCPVTRPTSSPRATSSSAVGVGRWEGGGTHTGAAFSDFLAGSLPGATGRKMHFTGTTVLRLRDGRIAEEIGLDDGVTALRQLGLIQATG